MGKFMRGKTYGSLVLGLVLILALFIFLPDTSSLRDSIKSLRNANPIAVCGAVLLVFLTYTAGAYALNYLSLRRLHYRQTMLVQLASGFAGKLVPAGIGGIALNTRYLTRHKHKMVEAGAVLTINGVLGFCGHLLIMITAFFMASEQFTETVSAPIPNRLWVYALAGFIGVAAVVLSLRQVRRWVLQTAREIRKISAYYATQPGKLIKGFLGASMVTLLFAGALNLSAFALGYELTALQVLLAYTACVIGIAVTPTPGGIGGAEAALTAALMAIGLEAGQALSVALLYRFVSYWLPILPGLFIFNYCLRRKYI